MVKHGSQDEQMYPCSRAYGTLHSLFRVILMAFAASIHRLKRLKIIEADVDRRYSIKLR